MESSQRRAFSLFRALIACVLLLAIAAGTLYLILTRTNTGGNAIDWAARQVVGIVERSIVPEIGFERFEYVQPRTIRFVNLSLTSPEGVRVAGASSVEVELTELPTYGEPVLIERIAVNQGMVELIETRDDDGGVGFEGLAPFVTPKGERRAETAEAAVQNYQGESLLSDVLRIRRVTLTDCGARYTPLSGDPPMRLTGVTTQLDLSPEEESGRLWHRFDIALGRGAALDAELAGRFDLDRLEVDLAPSTIRIDLSDGPAEELPPGVQALLTRFEARGRLEIQADGDVALRDMGSANANASVGLEGFNLSLGEYRLPIETALFQAKLVDGVATVERGDVSALGGQALVRGGIDLREDHRPMNLTWSVGEMHLREIIRGGTPEGQTPKLAGVVVSAGKATMDAGSGLGSLRGDGTIDVTKGRFGQIGFVERLVGFIASGGTASRDELASELHGTFTLRGEAMDFSKVTLKTPTISVRGEGVMHLDGRLDFVVNGGPLEKVQDLLGDVGRIFGAVTDQLVKYRIRGTVSEPDISVAPLGVGAGIDREELP